jgi:hypothetical protein
MYPAVPGCRFSGMSTFDERLRTVVALGVGSSHFSTDRRKTFFHSSSYTANPIACAAAVANLDIWRDKPVLERRPAQPRSKPPP